MRDGKVVYVGDDKTSSRFQGPATQVIELRGAVVVPGRDGRLDAQGDHARVPAALEPGTAADLSVLSEDPEALPAGDTSRIPVLFTIEEGKLRMRFQDTDAFQ